MANGERHQPFDEVPPTLSLTFDYWDPNTTVQVGDEPTARAPPQLEDGMAVSAQNVRLSLKGDVKAANGLVGRFTAGFYYKTFMKPAALWPPRTRAAKFAPVHRRPRRRPAAATTSATPVSTWSSPVAVPPVWRRLRPKVIGDARRARAPARRHLVWGSDEDRRGGRPRRPRRKAGVEILTDSTVTGRYEDNWVAIAQRNHPRLTDPLHWLLGQDVIVAAGTIERPYVFEGNDLPGVMTSGAVQRLVRMYGVKLGTQAVVFTANESGDRPCRRCRTPAARPGGGFARETIVSTSGSKTWVRRSPSTTAPSFRDLLVTVVGWTTPTSLLNMAGDRPVYDPTAARFFSTAPDGSSPPAA